MKSYELCLEIVFEVFNYNFRDHIAQFLHSFPPDHYYEDGSYRSPFWSGCKRCPQVVRFDLTDPTHVRFVRIGAEIYAKIFNIPSPNDESEIISLISKVY
jgi:ubiquitin-activating enzyme E1